ncbi:DUF445 domain-containing protein [Pseudonocardia sp. CA-107938]|uniref:DUF445 domain-containing protein n=1 Tax=Pseudonocardia sp. CA-107938 TaxID=3240021 RepID=UPI003D949968
MPAFLQDVLDHWLIYATMPVIAALIGYGTKIVAVEMMFEPVDFVGVRPVFGWQGIIPRNAGRMATIAMDLLLNRLIDPRAILARIDVDRLLEEIEAPLNKAVVEIGTDVLAKYQPAVWEMLPTVAQDLILRQLQARAPKVVAEIMTDISRDLEQYVDVRDMAITNLVRDRAVLNRLIREISQPEMRFIIRSGLYFGAIVGVLQAVVWALTHEPWIMPFFGGLIGLSSDWLALKMIFHPREERRILGIFRWQGLFHRRREQVAADYGRLIADEVLTIDHILEAVLAGPRSDRLIMTVQRHVGKVIDENIGLAKPLVVLSIGSTEYQQLRRDVAERGLAAVSTTIKPALGYAHEALDVEHTIVDAMLRLSPMEYEGVLRPAFRQDEWKLILVGGILGALVGELQVQLLLG